MAGTLLAVLACSFLAKRIEVAKLWYFESDDNRLFRRMAMPRLPRGTDT
jgi:aquaporin Z